jgi:hypothetical protein
LQTLLGLLKLSGKDAVVVCSSGPSRAALLQQLLGAEGCDIDQSRPAHVRVGERWLTVVAEVPSPPTPEKGVFFLFDRSRQHYDAVDASGLPDHVRSEAFVGPDREMLRPEREASGHPTSGELSPSCTVEVPAEAHGARLVVVYDALRETATLAKLLRALRPWGGAHGGLEVFHLVTDTMSTLVETEAERHEVDRLLTEEGQLQEDLELQDQRLPAGAVLMSGPPAADTGEVLPRVLDFRLKVPALGFVVRLRQRFGCVVPEVFYGALRSLCEAAGKGEGAGGGSESGAAAEGTTVRAA